MYGPYAFKAYIFPFIQFHSIDHTYSILWWNGKVIIGRAG